MKIERKKVIAAIGGPDAVLAMDDEARAEALENYLAKELDAQVDIQVDAQASAPTVAELEEKIETRTFRRGVGSLFAVGGLTPFGEPTPDDPGPSGDCRRCRQSRRCSIISNRGSRRRDTRFKARTGR